MLVLAGMSGSRLDQPREFIESRNEVDAMLLKKLVLRAKTRGRQIRIL